MCILLSTECVYYDLLDLSALQEFIEVFLSVSSSILEQSAFQDSNEVCMSYIIVSYSDEP